MRNICAALALFFCVFYPSNAGATNEADYRSGVEAIAAKYGAKRAWFRAEQAGTVLASVAIGGAAPNDGIQVASLSKSITAIAIALLIQDGKISLDTTLGELLPGTFKKKGYALAVSLQPITIRRLLTHTAGLKTNYGSDPIHGVASNPIFRRLNSNATVLEYIIAADANRSDGRSKFVYSNFSYSYLGLVVEAVSGKPYEVFCAERIFKPLGIIDAKIPGRWHTPAPYAGWRISMASMIKVWTSVFDRENPSLLTVKTLDETLLARLGEPRGVRQDVYYTLGVNTRQNDDRSAYRIWHNGIADYFWDANRYTYMEQTVPGVTWIAVIDRQLASEQRSKFSGDVRALVEKLGAR